jgi:ribosomal protein L29
MKVNDKKELHAKESSELRKMLKDGHELLLSLKLDREQNKLKNTRGIFHTRKNIAIIKTILKGKEGQEAPVVVTPAAKVEVKKEKAAKKETETAPIAK